MRLSIGIDQYADGENLTVCANDARATAALFGGVTLLNEAATHDAIVDGMTRAAESPAPGEWGVIVYSGHGSWYRDDNSDEPDRRDECLVAHDGYPLPDDDICSILARHARGAWLLFVTDCCHSGSIHRGPGEGGVAPGRVKFKRPESLRPRRSARPSKQPAVPGVVHIAACVDNRPAYEGDDGHGKLIGPLLRHFDPRLTIGQWTAAAIAECAADGWQRPGVNASREILAHRCAELV